MSLVRELDARTRSLVLSFLWWDEIVEASLACQTWRAHLPFHLTRGGCGGVLAVRRNACPPLDGGFLFSTCKLIIGERERYVVRQGREPESLSYRCCIAWLTRAAGANLRQLRILLLDENEEEPSFDFSRFVNLFELSLFDKHGFLRKDFRRLVRWPKSKLRRLQLLPCLNSSGAGAKNHGSRSCTVEENEQWIGVMSGLHFIHASQLHWESTWMNHLSIKLQSLNLHGIDYKSSEEAATLFAGLSERLSSFPRLRFLRLPRWSCPMRKVNAPQLEICWMRLADPFPIVPSLQHYVGILETSPDALFLDQDLRMPHLKRVQVRFEITSYPFKSSYRSDSISSLSITSYSFQQMIASIPSPCSWTKLKALELNTFLDPGQNAIKLSVVLDWMRIAQTVLESFQFSLEHHGPTSPELEAEDSFPCFFPALKHWKWVSTEPTTPLRLLSYIRAPELRTLSLEIREEIEMSEHEEEELRKVATLPFPKLRHLYLRHVWPPYTTSSYRIGSGWRVLLEALRVGGSTARLETVEVASRIEEKQFWLAMNMLEGWLETMTKGVPQLNTFRLRFTMNWNGDYALTSEEKIVKAFDKVRQHIRTCPFRIDVGFGEGNRPDKLNQSFQAMMAASTETELCSIFSQTSVHWFKQFDLAT